MPLLLVVLCVVAAAAVAIAARGPRRWYETVTLRVRPDAPEPSRERLRLLAVRNVVVALVVVAVAASVTLDRLRLSEDELVEATRAATDRIASSPEIDEARLETEVEVDLDHDVIIYGVAEFDGGTPPPDADVEVFALEVTSQTRYSDSDPRRDDGAPAACVVMERHGSGPAARVDVVAVEAGRCPTG